MKILKILLAVIFFVGILIAGGLFFMSKAPSVPDKYYEKLTTDGELEKKYLFPTNNEVEYFEVGALQNFEKYEIYYPKEMTTTDKKYPVIVVNNGTGTKASKYPALFKKWASYGFIVIGTEENFSWNGFSADMSLNYLLKSNDNKDSIFYNHVDKDNVGVVGHSQGGVGVFTSITDTKHKGVYKTAVALSPTAKELAKGLEWDYDATKIKIPTFLLSGTGPGDEKLVVNLEQLTSIYDDITEVDAKVMARYNGADHSDTLYFADGYVTAWFMWQLQGDETAKKVFVGDDAEITKNKNYIDLKKEIKVE